jgi:PAS domain S-box-containing protein
VHRKLAAAAALVIAFILVNGGLTLRNIVRLHRTTESTEASYRAILGASRVLSTIKDAETGQRGFLITGDSEYLKPHADGVGAVHRALDSLDLLTAGTPRHNDLVPALRKATESKLAELDTTLQLREASGFAAAQRVVLEGEGKQLMDSIRAMVTTIQADERQLLADRRQVAARSRTTALGSAVIATLVGLLLAWFCIALWRREAEARARSARAIEAEKELFRITIASIGDAVITTDPEGRVTSLNAVAEELTGWKRTEAVSHPLDRVFVIVNEDTREPVENPALRALREGIIVGLANHTVLIGRDGTDRPIDDSAAPIRDSAGVVRGAVLVFRDITERKRTEAALRDADRRKDEFMAVLAHELRNPLAPLQNAAAILRSEADAKPEVRRAIDIIGRQTGQMARLVDDLLDVSRITRGAISLRKRPMDLSQAVADAIEGVRPALEQRGHRLTVSLPDRPVLLEADPMRVTQVLLNLLHNAVKFTHPAGRIDLAGAVVGSVVVIRLRDTGIGISPEHMETVFDMFAQGDGAPGGAHGGLGVGLALARGLVQLHAGSLTAKSDGAGHGSEFTVELPLATTSAGTGAPARADGAPPPAQRGARRVLVVDDNVDAAESLAELVRLSGHTVRTAHDGREALGLATSFAPDLVLLDIGLPGMNGFDVAREIRQMPRGDTVVLVAVTGWGQEDVRRRSAEAGFNHHLTKPIDLDALRGWLAGPVPGVFDERRTGSAPQALAEPASG